MKSLKISSCILAAGILLFSGCKPRFEKEITLPEVQDHIAFLASDSLKGRYPGKPEDSVLSAYITGEFKKAGLILWEKKGIQYFPVVTSIQEGKNNSLSIDGKDYTPGNDFQPMPFSGNASVTEDIVFAGYGFNFKNDTMSWNDYNNLDVAGKVVLILLGNPDPSNARSAYVNHSPERGKVLLASDLGASGVIFVSGEDYDPSDELTSLKSREHQLSIPAIHLKRGVADEILKQHGLSSISDLESKLNSSLAPASFDTKITASFSADLEPEHVQTFNTIALLKGADPVKRSQYVIIGAHHDHLGMGGFGSSSRKQDTIAVHHGADDNASGVAGVLEIAEKMMTLSPERSVLFTTFGAEEEGLLGSRFLVDNSPVDPDSIQVMINLDMVGRLDDEKQLQIGGTGTSPVFEHLLDSINTGYGFKLKFNQEGYGASDHSSFYGADVPVLFFFTGVHTDYHTPEDTYDKINYEGAVEIYDFVTDVAEALADYPEKITFTEAGPKVRPTTRVRYGRITLGIMPDMNYDGNDGMPVLAVYKGRPAAAGGMKKGDVITAVDGKKVGNIYDYMSRLGQLEAGQSIIVTVLRDGDELNLLIQL